MMPKQELTDSSITHIHLSTLVLTRNGYLLSDSMNDTRVSSNCTTDAFEKNVMAGENGFIQFQADSTNTSTTFDVNITNENNEQLSKYNSACTATTLNKTVGNRYLTRNGFTKLTSDSMEVDTRHNKLLGHGIFHMIDRDSKDDQDRHDKLPVLGKGILHMIDRDSKDDQDRHDKLPVLGKGILHMIDRDSKDDQDRHDKLPVLGKGILHMIDRDSTDDQDRHDKLPVLGKGILHMDEENKFSGRESCTKQTDVIDSSSCTDSYTDRNCTGWVVTFCGFMISIIIDGICYTFGFFFIEMQLHFGSSKSVTALITSVLNGVYMFIGPFVGALINRFGCRKVAMVGATISSMAFFLCTYSPNVVVMIILYGVFGGIGFGLLYLPAIVIIAFYFKKRLALATGIAVCGSGIGSFAFPPINEMLISQFGWKGAMWILAGITLNGAVFASLMRTPPQHSDRHKQFDSKDDSTKKCCVMFDWSILKNVTFMLYCSSCLLCMIGFFVPLTFLPDIAAKAGMRNTQVVWIMSSIGIANTVGRVVSGYIVDKPWANAIYVHSGALIVAGMTTVGLPCYHAYPVLLIYSLVFGSGIATFVSLRSKICIQLLGVDKFASAIGVLGCSMGISSMLGTPLAGALFDGTGDYRLTCYVAGGVMALAGLLCIPLHRLSIWQQQSRQYEEKIKI